MKCPDCLLRIHKSAEECPHCGIDLGGLRKIFSHASPLIENGIQDLAGVLRKKMRESLEKSISKCQQQFSNLNIVLSFVALQEGERLESYGFWLLNDGIFKRNGVELGNDNSSVIIVVEVNRKLLGMNFGYMLDEYVAEGECFDVLAEGHASFLEGDYVRGGDEILSALRTYLRVVCGRAIKGKKVNR